MKVKRGSWHYRISKLGSYESSKDNLCVYFWAVIIKIALMIFIPSTLIFIGYFFFTDPMWVSNLILLTFIFSAIGLPPLTIYLIRKKLLDGESPEMPYGNIVVEYIKAKKAKICPLIEYTD